MGGTICGRWLDVILFLADVMMVNDRLLGFRLGGLRGRENEPSLVLSAVSDIAALTFGRDVAIARGVPEEPVVLTAKFFKFLGRLPGVCSRCRSKKVALRDGNMCS